MNGFVVFDSPLDAERFLEHPAVTGLCAAAQLQRATSLPAVVTFEDLTDDQVSRLRDVVSALGGEIEASRRYDPLGSP
jgi:hypothetical protein